MQIRFRPIWFLLCFFLSRYLAGVSLSKKRRVLVGCGAKQIAICRLCATRNAQLRVQHKNMPPRVLASFFIRIARLERRETIIKDHN